MTNTTNNTPIPDAELAELRRRHAAAGIDQLGYKAGTLKDYVFGPDGDTFGFSVQRLHWNDGRDTNSENICPAIVATFNAFPGLIARLEEVERERDELRLTAVAEWLEKEADREGYGTYERSVEGMRDEAVDLRAEAKRLREGGE